MAAADTPHVNGVAQDGSLGAVRAALEAEGANGSASAQAPILAPLTSAPEDFVDLVMDYTEGRPTPTLFRQWAALSCLAGALERRVWLETSVGYLFPHLYVMLVAPPGGGKDVAVKPIRDIWARTRRLKLSPDSMTAASMLDALGESRRTVITKGRLVADFHSMQIAAPEMGVFCPAHDNEFLSRLNAVYEAPETPLRVKRKYLKEEVSIAHPQVNLLVGAQPQFLATLLPEQAWSLGFMSRMIMVYSLNKPKLDIFGARQDRGELRDEIVRRMNTMMDLYGQVMWEPEAAEEIQRWYDGGMKPAPIHVKLMHYCERRLQHVLKLALLASVSRTCAVEVVRLPDVHRAIAWLTEAEVAMADIFRDMYGKNDIDLLREMHHWLSKVHMREKKGVNESAVMYFLAERTTHEKVPRLLELAQRANMIRRTGTLGLYEPVPEADHGAIQ